MQIEPTSLPGALLVTPRRFEDSRGWLSETWSRRTWDLAGLDQPFVQDNHVYSDATGTVRGLHAQRPPHAQAKLVSVVAGAILDVAVDARRGSPTFGAWVAEVLSAENGRQLFVPVGFLHGYATLVPGTHVMYKCTSHYEPGAEVAVAWGDPDLSIDWMLSAAPIVSDKDRAAPRWADWSTPFSYEGAGQDA